MPIFKIKILDREYPIEWNMGAWLAAEERFQKPHAQALQHAVELGKSNRMRFVMEMSYCMTRTLDQPPTLQEIQKMDMKSMVENAQQITGALNFAMDGGIPAKKESAAGAPGGVARSGTGGRRSSGRRN
jgi:hypothetical protein